MAVYLVVLFHAEIGRFSGGFVGVDLFFVLSGFLMTSLLLIETSAKGRIDVRAFYARRVRRLLPASIVTIVLTLVALVLLVPFSERLGMVSDARSALLYVSNLQFIRSSEDYFRAADSPSAFLHFWSLSLEEQFYFAFPLLMVVVGRIAVSRRSAVPVVVVLGLIATASLALQVYWNERNPLRAYYGTDARVYQILAGGILGAVILMRPVARSLMRSAPVVAVGGLVGLVIIGTDVIDVSVSTRGMLATVLSMMAIGGLELGAGSAVASAMSRSPLVYLGRVSYGVYLAHWPITVFVTRFYDWSPWVVAVVVSIAATGVAAISFALLESPIRRSAGLARHKAATVVSGLAVSAVVALLVAPAALESRRRPVVDHPGVVAVASVERGAQPAPKGVNYRRLKSERAVFPTCPATDPSGCTIVTGENLSILIVGDSHARMLIPAFRAVAEAQGHTLTVNVMPRCPWPAGYELIDRPRAERRQCTRLREQWFATAGPILQPDLVVVAQLARDEPEEADRLGPSDPELADLLDLALHEELARRTLDVVASHADRVVIVEPLPSSPFNPLDCLSGASTLSDCAFAAGEPPPSEAVYRALAADYPNVSTLDLDHLVCPEHPVCLPVVDGVVAWRDPTHITVDLSEVLAEQIWALTGPPAS